VLRTNPWFKKPQVIGKDVAICRAHVKVLLEGRLSIKF